MLRDRIESVGLDFEGVANPFVAQIRPCRDLSSESVMTVFDDDLTALRIVASRKASLTECAFGIGLND